MIYLPLYDGVNWLEVGVDNNSTITKPMIDNPRAGKKIIMYGTSILQGGCSTRTGMVSTSMIQRDLNCEVVNIGISGEGK
ncbi:MAG: SGNH/GDSL hydrolase family protein, partial [Muribaculaceae bacterium]